MEFAIPLQKATKIREWAEQKGAELLPPSAPGIFTTEHTSIQILGDEPLVVSVLRLKDADGKLIPTTLDTAMMRVVTSEVIAAQEGFLDIISPDPAPKRKRLHFDLTPVSLDRSKFPSRKEIEASLQRSETSIELALKRRRKGLYSKDGTPLSDVIIDI
ncbi:MAG: hypothetical protein PHQ59_04145 [Candidatus Daviesbacteria bacterium]|nr:hypothetical protein [Candidatus Daviesbacteria bacterium]